MTERIQRFMEIRGLNQYELAQASKLSPSTIHKILVGKTTRPGHETLRLIARALGVGITELTGDEELDTDEVPEEDLIRRLALQYGGPSADWRELAKWIEVYRQHDPEARKRWLEMLRWNADRANRDGVEEAQQG